MYKRFTILLLLVILIFTNLTSIYGSTDDITSNSYIVMDSDSLAILYNKNMHKKIYPASTTKVLTAILAIENLNLDSNITASKEAISVPPLSSTINIKEGEILTVRDLLYGLLLRSGNDAANVLAEAVSGSISNFMFLMNKRLKELGCNNTYFTNPHGYHDENHYSTVYDMAILMKYASGNEIFKTICSTKEYTVAPTNKTTSIRRFKNTNTLLDLNLEYNVIGKTGYTDEAGNTFLCYATLNNKNIICGIFEGKNKNTVFKDTMLLINYIFNNFNKVKILDKNTFKVPYVDRKNGIQYILGIDNDLYSLIDTNKYYINYTLSNVEITDNDVKGVISITMGNDNWNYKGLYDLKILEIKKLSILHNNIESELNINILLMLSLTVILIITLIVWIFKRKNYEI